MIAFNNASTTRDFKQALNIKQTHAAKPSLLYTKNLQSPPHSLQKSPK